MLVQDFKVATRHLPLTTKVFTTAMTPAYTRAHPECVSACAISPQGEIDHVEGETLTLAEFYRLPDDQALILDVEDGFIYHPIKELCELDIGLVIA